MLAAAEVRLDFVARTVNSRKHTKPIAAWALARAIGRDRTYAHWVSAWGEPEILGVTNPGQHCADAAPTRHGQLLWAAVCSAYEAEFPKDAWRHTDHDRAAYLTHLVSLGYTPCDSGQLMITNADTASSEPDLDDEIIDREEDGHTVKATGSWCRRESPNTAHDTTEACLTL